MSDFQSINTNSHSRFGSNFEPSHGSTLTRLEQVDWSFSERAKAPAIEGVHPYPAKFIGDIPRAFIENLNVPTGTAVFDPFCGSGTTLVEAQRAGHASVGIDLNPIACLLATVKTAPLPSHFEDAVAEVIAIARLIKATPPSEIPNVNHWFKADIQHAISSIAMTIARTEFRLWLPQLRLALSSILVRVSNQDSDTRYAAVHKDVNGEDVFSYFSNACSKLHRALKERNWALAATKIIEGNTLQTTPEQIGLPVGLVVTSPPYPNAYEYWLYHKYRMWWLGFDPLAVKEQEIGARAHFFKKNPHTADRFVEQMRTTFSLIDSVLVSKGYVCFVVGRSKIHGKIIDNGNIIERVAIERELVLVRRFEREIKANRKSFNLSHANIKTESMLVFKKS